MTQWLVVRSAGRTVAVPAHVVHGVVEVPPPLPAPGTMAAVRGVMPVRGQLVPLAHLAATIADVAPPETVSGVGVVLQLRGWRLVLEVDEAADLRAAVAEPLPDGWRGRWAASAIREADGLVPTLDLEWLMGRLGRGGERTTA